MNQRKPTQTIRASTVISSIVRVYFIFGGIGLLLILLIGLVIWPGLLDVQFMFDVGMWLIVGIGLAILGHGYTKKERTGQGSAIIVIGWVWLIAVFGCIISTSN
jgi:hypothetical protein